VAYWFGFAAGPGISPDVCVVRGRISQPSAGERVCHGPVQAQHQRRGVVLVPWIPCAGGALAHLHG